MHYFFSEQPLVRVLVVAMAYQEQQQYIVVYRRRQQEGRLFSPDKRDGNH